MSLPGLLLLFAIGGIGLGLLSLANFNPRGRFRQFPFVVASAVMALVAALFFLRYRDLYYSLAQLGEAWLAGVLAAAGVGFSTAASDFPAALNLLALFALAMVKGAMRGYFELQPRFRRTFRRVFHRARDRPAHRLRRGLDTHLGYEYSGARGVLLKREGYFVRFAALAFAALAGALLLAGLLSFAVDLSFPLPLLPALPLLMLLELAFYLGGSRPEAQPGSVAGAGPGAREAGDYRRLWERYQTIWPSHWLAANTRSADAPATPAQLSVLDDRGRGRTADLIKRLQRHRVELAAPWSRLLNDLAEGRDVIVEGLVHDPLAAVVIARLEQVFAEGGRAVLITSRRRVRAWRQLGERWFRGPARVGGEVRIGQVLEGPASVATADLLVLTPGELIDVVTGAPDWLPDVRLALLPDVEESFAHPYIWRNALHVLLDRLLPEAAGEGQHEGGLQIVACSGLRQGVQPALRSNLPFSGPEHVVTVDPPRFAYHIAWREEQQPWYQQALFGGRLLPFMGAQVPLAVLAWKEGVEHVVVNGVDTIPWLESCEELSNHRAQLEEMFKVDEHAADRLEFAASPWTGRRYPRRVGLTRDASCNLPATLRAESAGATECVLACVACPPYLLREYFADNLDYFLQFPFEAFSPQLLETGTGLAFALRKRLCAGELEENVVLEQVQRVYADGTTGVAALRGMYRDLFGIDIVATGLLTIRRAFRTTVKGPVPIRYLSFAASMADQPVFGWDATFTVVEGTSGTELSTIKRHALHQLLLPGQVRAFDGRAYRVDHILDHPGQRVVRCTHVTPAAQPVYLAERRVRIEEVWATSNDGWNRAEDMGQWRAEAAIRECRLVVETRGYFEFEQGLDLRDGRYRAVSIAVPDREYPRGRFLRLRIALSGDLPGDRDRTAFTLAFLVNGLLPTLFPESHPFVLCTTPLPDGFFAADRTQAIVGRLFPALTIVEGAGAKAGFDRTGPTTAIDLYLVEDSVIDMGLLLPFRDRWREVLVLIDDYLAWEMAPARTAPEPWRSQSRKDYLNFGFKDRPPMLDLDAVRALLSIPGAVSDANPLRSRRMEYQSRAAHRSTPSASGIHADCDFCGERLLDTGYETLDDGRMRCKKCAADAVDSVEQLAGVYATARKFMWEDLKVEIRDGIDVHFASAAEISVADGDRFIPTSGFDTRAVGRAISRTATGAHPTILIENGHRYHSTLATVVHELTHLWQFDNLDFQKMKIDYGLDLVEGQAVWAELECMRQLGLPSQACEAQAARDDEYGRGYRTVLEMHRRHGEIGTPFDTLTIAYPR